MLAVVKTFWQVPASPCLGQGFEICQGYVLSNLNHIQLNRAKYIMEHLQEGAWQRARAQRVPSAVALTQAACLSSERHSG